MIAAAILLASCTKMVYVPVESVITEYRNVQQRDSIHLYDSVYLRDKGDTVWIEKYERLYIDRTVLDTTRISDTIRVPYPVKTVEKEYVHKIEWYERILIYTGILALILGIIYLIRKKTGA
jgi:hypothetical protein